MSAPAAATAHEQRGEVAGIPTVWLEAPSSDVPVVYIHGVPTDGDDFVPFLELTGGLAPDLPGFGRSGKPSGFDYSIGGYADWFRAFLAARGVERYSLVVHDWGAAVLAHAMAEPDRVERLVVIDAVPLLPGYRWHRIARAWRIPVVGELAMGLTTRSIARVLSRDATADRRPLPDDVLDRVWERLDHGTQRAILRLYRSAPAKVLEAAGRELGRLHCPALVVWGRHDRYLPCELAGRYAEALGGPAEVDLVEDSGHWPWLERPELVVRVARFLTADGG